MPATVEAKQIAVLGAGTWGLALAKVLWENGHTVRLWDFFPAVTAKLAETRVHPRLKNLHIPESVVLTGDLAEALRGAEVIVVVVPSTAIRSTCETIKAGGLASPGALWVLCSKGIEDVTLLPLHSVMAEVLGSEAADRIAILAGPSHAEEVAQGLPTTIVAAATDLALARDVQRIFLQPRFRVYTNDDVTGAELGGALKNVIAIAAGVADGMGFGDNARGALITRGLVEIIRLGVALGARQETFMGLTGLGDLIVTATSVHSRNHQFGELLAKGRTRAEALKEVGMVVEGDNTVRAAHLLGERHGIEMPITEAVWRVLHEDVPAPRAIEELLAREAKDERIAGGAK